MECKIQDKQVEAVTDYLRKRNGKGDMANKAIAHELMISENYVSVLIASGALKSRAVEDVASYIVELT